jgi:ABC-type branched-subunit amino acid transport system substrate-binding protein
MMKRHLTVAAALALGSGLFVAAGGAPGAGASSYPPIPAGPIVVGATTPLSGPTAADGISTEESFNGVTMKAFNAEFPDGIDGHPVKLVFLDDQGTVTGGVQSAEELVSDHVAAVVTASYNPEATADQLTVWQKAKIPVISQLSGNQYANTKEYPYDFAVGASLQEEGTATAKWIKNEGFKRIAVLTDGFQEDTEQLDDVEAAVKKDAPEAKIVTTQTVPPDSVEVSAAISALKDSNPDLVYIDTYEDFGAVWQTMQTQGLTTVPILTGAGAWYNAFSSMGSLADHAYAYYDDCATSVDETWPANVNSLMAQYSAATYAYSTNYLTYVATDTVPLLLLKAAITKEHSDSPAAIKAGMESIHNETFDTIEYDYTASNHFGVTGVDGPAVCKMAPPYAGGVGKVPIKSNG